MSRLLIVSDMAHYRRDGALVGWGPTVEEIDHLATMFSEVRHLGCLHPGPAPASALPYRAANLTFIPLPPTGGPTLRAKLDILRRVPRYWRTIWRELGAADVVHVRCPCNVGLVGLAALALARHPRVRWVKYAGNWRPDGADAWSYALQRWWLERNLHRGVVTVNGTWAGQQPHVHSFPNPCLSSEELAEARQVAAAKSLTSPIRLLYVGRVEAEKGVFQVLDVLDRLAQAGRPARLDVVGGGSALAALQARAAERSLESSVTFHGWLPRPAIVPLYAAAHLILLPSRSEGWPKVLSEAMAFGVVPLASAVSRIPQQLAAAGTGRALSDDRPEAYADAVTAYLDDPATWRAESGRAAATAAPYSYPAYLTRVRELLTVCGARLAHGVPEC